MKNTEAVRALYIIANAGHYNDIVEIAREEGATGATIMHARGSSTHHEVFMGITLDSEKEIVLCLAEESVAEKIMLAVKKKAGYNSPARTICFTMPVEKVIGIKKFAAELD